MRSKFWTILALALVVPGLMMFWGCTPKSVGPDDDQAGNGGVNTPTRTDDSDSPTPTPIPYDQNQGNNQPSDDDDDRDLENTEQGRKFVNEDIHFEFDSSALSSQAQGILKDKANFMNQHKKSSVTVEGHCDERGTNEYNLALGDRRAESVKSFLLKLGISASRMKTISYGEERPLDPGHDEEAWAKNRRAHFLLQK